ncbi:MAG: hypothetical protein IPJ95_07660 [Gemmatimonadetes bacterium]|nr:hypothetical protein [Gemmatimonadota bacterium]MBK7923497.1 hypothetical protein [Gemmatimonadota bacterium]MBK9692167.1 hypothetical protein [Gemmatimonadota bacterium]
MPPDGTETEVDFWTFLLLYVLLVSVGVALALAGSRCLYLDGTSIVVAYCGAVFLFAAIERPRVLFVVVRSIGWFALLPRPLIKALLMISGVLLLFGALTGKFH